MKIEKKDENVGVFANRQNGITLIALVITIVILIILSGVAINMTIGEKGIFTRAKQAKEQYELATIKEEIDLAILEIQAEGINKDVVTLDIMLTKLQEKLSGTEITKDGDKLKGNFNGYDFTIDENFSVIVEESNLESANIVVTSIGTTYYNSLTKAIEAVPIDNNQTTIVLLRDTTENITVKENQNIELNLNNYTITNKSDNYPVIYTLGKISIKNGTISASIGNTNAINNYGILNISGTASITGNSDSKATIFNSSEGKLIMTAGTVVNTSTHYAIYNDGGSVQVTGGTVSSKNF